MNRPRWLGPEPLLSTVWAQVALGVILALFASAAAFVCIRLIIAVLRVTEGVCS